MRSGGFRIYFGYRCKRFLTVGKELWEGNLKFGFGYAKFKMPHVPSRSIKEADGYKGLKFRRGSGWSCKSGTHQDLNGI